MENTPIPPRQRNRRADRYSADAAPMAADQQAYSAPDALQSMRLPAQQADPYRQNLHGAQTSTRSTTPVYQQPSAAHRTGYPYQQQIYPQRVQQPQQAYPQAVQQSRQAYPRVQQPRPTAASVQQPSARLPRALQHQASVQSGWQTPNPVARSNAPRQNDRYSDMPVGLRRSHAMEDADMPDDQTAADTPEKLPRWLVSTLALMLIAVMGLVAAKYLMHAFLKTEEDKRLAAWQAVLNNYHVTTQPDGSLGITWQGTIEQYAAEYNLQPAFVAAIIRTESSFRTNAESSVGARGLMQLMPARPL